MPDPWVCSIYRNRRLERRLENDNDSWVSVFYWITTGFEGEPKMGSRDSGRDKTTFKVTKLDPTCCAAPISVCSHADRHVRATRQDRGIDPHTNLTKSSVCCSTEQTWPAHTVQGSEPSTPRRSKLAGGEKKRRSPQSGYHTEGSCVSSVEACGERQRACPPRAKRLKDPNIHANTRLLSGFGSSFPSLFNLGAPSARSPAPPSHTHTKDAACRL